MEDLHFQDEPESAREEARKDAWAVVEIGGTIHRFGHPNDEVLHGHALHEAGLEHYAAMEIKNSPWIDELVKVNSVHENHDDAMFEGLRHFIFTFQDSTFEGLSQGYRVTRVDEGPGEPMQRWSDIALRGQA